MPAEDDEQGEARRQISKEAMMESIHRSRKGDPRVGRRRRRRTYQPKYEKARRRRVVYGVLLGVMVLFIVAVVGAILTTKMRLEGDRFREELGGVFQSVLGGEVTMGELKLRGTSVIAPWVRVEGGYDGQLERVELREVEVKLEVPSFVGTTWVVRSLTIDECEIVIDPARGARAVGGESLPRGGGIEEMEPRVGLMPVPLHWEIGELEVDIIRLEWKGTRGREGVVLDGVRMLSTNFAGMKAARVVEGEVTGFGNDKFEVWDGEIVFEEGGLSIRDGKLRSLEGEGVVVANGRVTLGGGGESEVGLRLLDIALHEVLPEQWSQRVSGRVNGDLTIRQEMGLEGLPDIEGEVAIAGGEIRDFELLDRLSDFCGESKLMRAGLGDEASARVARKGGIWSIDEISLTTPGLLRVTGNVELAPDGAISGQLQVGVPEAYLVRSMAGRPAFFGKPQGGFSMAEVRVWSEDGEMLEDLSRRLADHAGGATRPSISTVRGARPGAPGGTKATGRGLIDDKAKMEELFNALLEQ